MNRWVALVAISILAVGMAAAPSLGSSPPSSSPPVSFSQVGHYPSAVAFYGAAKTIYTVNTGDNDLSVINGRTCNATVTSGCDRVHPTQDVGREPSAMMVDERTHTLYVANYSAGSRFQSVSVVDARRCNASNTTGCTHYPHLPLAIRMPFHPNDIAMNPVTNTIYVAGDSAGPGNHDLAVINRRTCNGTNTTGCRRGRHIAHVPQGAGAVAVNPKTNTIYTTSYFTGVVSVIDGRRCNAADTSGCGRPVATFHVGRNPWRIVVDAATHTIYVSNFSGRTVSLINSATCNRAKQSGCRTAQPKVRVGRGPQPIGIDDRDHLGFVGNAFGDTVSVFDTSTCAAANTSGCARRTATVKVGPMPSALWVNQANATVYVANTRTNTLAIFRATMPGRS